MQHTYGSRSDEAAEGGEPSHRQPQAGLNPAQEEQLRELFEKHGMEKGYLDVIVSHFGAGLSKARMGSHLKALGLKRGVLTNKQVRHSPLFAAPGTRRKS